MARRHHNPDFQFFGEDVEDLALKATGIALTSWVNKNIVKPLAEKAIHVSGLAAKGLDLATTAGSAVISGEVVGLLSRRVGRDIRTGGMILTGAKLVAVPVPGFSVDASLPSWFDRLRPPFLTGTVDPAAVAAGVTATAALAPGAQPDYPEPDPDSDIGL